jgi:hypothetical protein
VSGRRRLLNLDSRLSTLDFSALVPLAGSAVLAAFAVASLPWEAGILRKPLTPFDLSAADSVAPGYALLRAAALFVPRDGSVVTCTEPRDPVRESYFYRFTVALLPGRRVLPTAIYGKFMDPGGWRDAAFQIVVGARPAEPPGDLLLDTPWGSVWRRARR